MKGVDSLNKSFPYKPTIIALLIVNLIFALLFLNNFEEKFVIGQKESNSVLNKDVVKTTHEFIDYLFEGENNKAGNLSLGLVRFNILSNTIENSKSFSIKNISFESSFLSDTLAVVNSRIEYVDNNKKENDLIFYEIKLLKENESWKVFSLNEVEPALSISNLKNTVDEKTENEIISIFKNYTHSLSKGEYEKASQYLIGKAKKMHTKANAALSKLNTVGKITELYYEPVHLEENAVVYKLNYKNNGTPLSVLAYFYRTGEGWKIYNVNQI